MKSKFNTLKQWAVMLCAAFITVLAQAEDPASENATAGQDKKPNIVFIMGDDIGIWNIGAYHRGMMAGQDAESR